MLTRAELKTNAKHALEGKWGKGALISLCYVLVFFGIGLISGILKLIPFLGMFTSIATVVIEIPIALGIIFSFIKLKRGEEVGAFDFLKLGFSNFKKSWAIVGNTLLKMIVPIIIMVVLLGAMIFFGIMSVGTLVGGSIINNSGDYSYDDFDLNAFRNGYMFDEDSYSFDDISYNPYARSTSSGLSNRNSNANLSAGLIGVSIGSAIALLVLSLAYFGVSIWATCKGLYYALAQFIAYDNPNMTGKEIVQKSEELMKGNRGKLFILNLSFIGWAILASLTLGIGMLWLLPYMTVTLVCFYEMLAGKDSNNTNNAVSVESTEQSNQTNENI